MVDIVFVSYNNGRDSETCFSSLEKNTEAYHSVIVVDNGSLESEIEEVERRSGILKKGAFTLVRNERNLGYAKALNRGIGFSTKPIIVFANMDISFSENWLPPLVEQFTDERVAFAGGKELDRRGRLYSCGIGGTERKRYHRGLGRRDRGQYDEVEDVISLSGALFAARRDVFDEIGLFDENFFLYFEETEIHIRARRAGYRVVYTPSSSFVHFMGGSTKPTGARGRLPPEGGRREKRRFFRESERYFNAKLGFAKE
jgi:hypothetical protein